LILKRCFRLAGAHKARIILLFSCWNAFCGVGECRSVGSVGSSGCACLGASSYQRFSLFSPFQNLMNAQGSIDTTRNQMKNQKWIFTSYARPPCKWAYCYSVKSGIRIMSGFIHILIWKGGSSEDHCEACHNRPPHLETLRRLITRIRSEPPSSGSPCHFRPPQGDALHRTVNNRST